MIDWYSKIDTLKSESFLPRLLFASGETIGDPSYYWENSDRPDTPHILFKYTLSGRGNIEVDGQVMNVDPGQGFLMNIPANNTKYYYPANSKLPWKFIYCCFTGTAVSSLYNEITSKYGHVFSLNSEHQLIRDILELRQFDVKAVNATNGADFIFRLFTALVHSSNEQEFNCTSNLLIDKAMDFIRANLGRQINVSEVSMALGVSREHLTRLFRQYLDVTPRNYIEKERLYTSLGLLRETELGVKQIAYRCGFSSASQFGRVFRRIMKDTPGNYRIRSTVPVVPFMH